MGRLHKLQGHSGLPSYLPPGRGANGHHPHPTKYVWGNGTLGLGYYSVQTIEAFELLIKRLRCARALVQSELDDYDYNTGCFRAPFKLKSTKRKEKQVFASLRHKIQTLTCLLVARAKASGPLADTSWEPFD